MSLCPEGRHGSIYPAARECDVIVVATPLYDWNMSGQPRIAIDRVFALEEGLRTLQGKARRIFYLLQNQRNDKEYAENRSALKIVKFIAI